MQISSKYKNIVFLFFLMMVFFIILSLVFSVPTTPKQEKERPEIVESFKKQFDLLWAIGKK